MINYIKGIFKALGSLLTGMKVTFREFFTKKITECYPENRATLKMNDRFCGELTMPTAPGHGEAFFASNRESPHVTPICGRCGRLPGQNKGGACGGDDSK